MNDNIKKLHHVALKPLPTTAWALSNRHTKRAHLIAKTDHHRFKMALPKNRAP